jgi:hypothetical protein
MSTFSQQYHFQDQPIFIEPHAFSLGHYDPGRHKTPTDSLINHTGLSPTPLTTTPPLSRNPSRPPEPLRDHTPDHLLWDNGSLSNSPTSVRTPDGDSFEVEMLDSESIRNFYHHNGANMATQASHHAVPAVDSSMFFTPNGTISDHGMSVDGTGVPRLTGVALQAALHATLASQAQQYPQQYNGQSTLPDSFHTAQLQNNPFTQNYTTQPSQLDPWNGQGPSRSSMTPRTGGVIFDAMTDPVNYADYLRDDVGSWTMNYTDPNFLVSPSEQVALPQENPFSMAAQHNLAHRPQMQNVPVHFHHPGQLEMQLTPASPSPDHQNFVNYDASSSLFTDNYITAHQYAPSSPAESLTSRHAIPQFQPTISPSAASPGSSDGAFSYQQSDSSMMLDPFPIQLFNQALPPPPTSMVVDYSHSQNAQNVSFSATPEAEPFNSAASLKNQQLSKSGGRALGTHLEPTVAKAAHDMRKITACWHCVLQRDKCGPGDPCERCLKRSQRPNADCGLGCTRIKLVDLATYFLPGLVTQMHEDSHLKHFVSQFIHQWGSVEITVYMTCGQHNMPRIPVKVYEFVPRGNELLEQIQYVTDPSTNKRVAVKKQSPALGMVHINHNEEKTYDRYITEIVDKHLDAFGELCWMEDDNDFQQKLFKLMTRVKPKSDDEVRKVRLVVR